MLEFYADELIIGETYYQDEEGQNYFKLEQIRGGSPACNLMRPLRVVRETYFYDIYFPELVSFSRSHAHIWYK